MDELLGFRGKRVLITGAASGMGAAVLARMSLLGAHVTAMDLIPPKDSVDRFVPLDLTRRESIAAAAAVLEEVDAVFHCAGVSAGNGLSPRDVIRVNFIGTRELSEAVLPKIAKNGAIAFVSSLAALRYRENRADSEAVLALDWDGVDEWMVENDQVLDRSRCYPFSKEAIVWYALTLTGRLSEQRIRVNVTAPGPTDTPFLAGSLARDETRRQLDAFPHLLGRRATPSEQADALVFLNSALGSYVNGQVLWVDGGYRAGVSVGAINPVMGENARYV